MSWKLSTVMKDDRIRRIENRPDNIDQRLSRDSNANPSVFGKNVHYGEDYGFPHEPAILLENPVQGEV